MIPAILHQTWKSHRIPWRLRRFVRTWQRTQKWDHRFYTDTELRAVIESSFPRFLQLYDHFEHPLERVDLARYALLYLHGGVYADLDMECIRSLEPLMATDQVILGREPDEHLHIYRFQQILCNALLMSPARHPFWLDLMDYISEKYQHGGDVVYNTGPMAITLMHRERPHAFQDVQLAPANWFYPIIDSRFGGKKQGRFRHVSWNCNVDEAYTAHHWLHTNDTLWNRFKTTIQTTAKDDNVISAN